MVESATPVVETEIPELGIEINYERRYNLGDFNHKIFNVKISGTNANVEEWLKNQRARLTKYIREVENIVNDAHQANLKKAEAEAAPTNVQP